MQPPPPPANSSAYISDPSLVSDADLLLNLHSPYSTASSPAGRGPAPGTTPTASVNSPTGPYPSQQSHTLGGAGSGMQPGPPPNVGPIPFGDMMIETQDMDMSALGDNMGAWLEWLPHDMVNWLDSTTTGTTTGADGGVGTVPPGQGDMHRDRE
ncbi:uncharacterized protein LTHEOB_2643 [Neofusicoccum parvum]|uniref:Uncharacterized protein LTHEOB_2643 n=1 Tax=Neofusicoccum parvum TaxID=310453 RepID=A0ACB5S7C9_9PEZI|nr:uncharacterized protein LTHEOB_2643 [Neofusicoccum parvum]GME58729.1 uncharacterized protein LTHEOB_2643 [Neofusicoccum parvum]